MAGSKTSRKESEPWSLSKSIQESKAAGTVAAVADIFLTEWPSSAEIYLPGGKAPKAKSLYPIKALAETYIRVITQAEAAGGNRDRQIERARKVWCEGFPGTWERKARAILRIDDDGAVLRDSGDRYLSSPRSSRGEEWVRPARR